MASSLRRAVAVLVVACVSAGCVSDGDDAGADDEAPATPEVAVTVPPERLTPFCEAMVDLSDQLLSGEVDDSEALIIDTYRSILPEVPAEIAADFDAVLAALEAGEPPPTDPTLPVQSTTPATTAPPTTQTPPPTATPATGSSAGSTVPGAVGVDEGFAPGTSPTERINNYVSFACLGTRNNPGPPATQPLEE